MNGIKQSHLQKKSEFKSDFLLGMAVSLFIYLVHVLAPNGPVNTGLATFSFQELKNPWSLFWDYHFRREYLRLFQAKRMLFFSLLVVCTTYDPWPPVLSAFNKEGSYRQIALCCSPREICWPWGFYVHSWSWSYSVSSLYQ